MKSFEVTKKTINGNKFYIRPFPALKCAYISGEVFSFLSPILSSLIPIATEALKNDNEGAGVYDKDITSAITVLSNGLGTINGLKVESLLKKLLFEYKTISVEQEGENEAQLLTEELADEVFCGEVQDMFVLAYEVIRVNFPGIFKKLDGQFGNVLDGLLKKMKASINTESSTLSSSAS